MKKVVIAVVFVWLAGLSYGLWFLAHKTLEAERANVELFNKMHKDLAELRRMVETPGN